MAKTGKKEGKPKVFYAACQGKRDMKYEFLMRETADGVKWRTLRPVAPNYFFTPKDFSAKKKYDEGISIVEIDDSAQSEYDKGVSIEELFLFKNAGCKTDRDALFIDMSRSALADRVRKLLSGKYSSEFAEQYKVRKAGEFDSGLIVPIEYRPFDQRPIYYDRLILSRPAYDTMRHLIGGGNLALLTTRSFPAHQDFTHAHVSRRMSDIHACGGQTYVFPLWVWEGEVGPGAVRRANFCKEIAQQFAKRMKMRYSENGDGKKRGVVSPESLFDYIYAVLHRPSYREKFAEFLRIDYPRIPAAADEREFRRVAKLGGELRALHLLESPFLERAKFPFSADGPNEVDAKGIRFSEGKSGGKRGRVFINAERHFAHVPVVAWEYCIGGYYPAQKWLKDRNGRALSFDDQRHYRRMLAALARTAEIADKLDGR